MGVVADGSSFDILSVGSAWVASPQDGVGRGSAAEQRCRVPPPDQPLTPFWSDHQASADARADLVISLATSQLAFLRTEKVKVREGMPELKGHEILKEVARRWKLHKLVNTNSSPLMLTHNDDDDDEDETLGMLQQLTPEELRHNLVAAGIDVHNDPVVNARRLLRHIMDA